MKTGDLVTWVPNTWGAHGIADTSDIVGTIIEGPTMFGLSSAFMCYGTSTQSRNGHTLAMV